MKKFAIFLTGSLFTIGTLLSTASAALIDFTAREWASVSGTSYSKTLPGNLTIELTSLGGSLTFNADDPPGLINIPPLEGYGDGIGIIDDEVSSLELLTLTFSSAIDIKTLYLLDLFSNTRENESAQISLDGVTWINVPASSSASGLQYGFVNLDLISLGLLSTTTTTIQFMTNNDNGISDYSVAGLEYSEVPEPTAMILFGAGVTAIASAIRRKK